MTEDDFTFSNAMEELETILRRIEGDEVELDDLASEVERASVLITACRETIDRTEKEVKVILADLEDEDS